MIGVRCMVSVRIKVKFRDYSSGIAIRSYFEKKPIMEDIKCEQTKCSRTAKWWLTYIDYIDTLKLFIRAERVGNWNMHIIAVGRMLNLFAATGYFNYAKSARMHLQ